MVLLNLDPQLVVGNHKDPFIQSETSLPLTQIIPRIIAERGSFLNLTEESLSEEINAEREALTKQALRVEEAVEMEENDGDGAKERAEAFFKTRTEVVALVQSAHNEASLTLDFVSLMISAVKPSLGNLTMSPHLKQHVPAGSLTSREIHVPLHAGVALQPPKLIHTDEGSHESELAVPVLAVKLGQGWKLESLDRVSGLLRESSIRLGEEVLREKRYWNNIHHVMTHSTSLLFKLREGRVREIGVKYGYHESGSRYHLDKGVAILKRLPNGELAFNPVSTHVNTAVTHSTNTTTRGEAPEGAEGPEATDTTLFKFVRVRVLSRVDGEFIVTGESACTFPLVAEGEGVEGITTQIERAQFLLFENELFYLLTREAGALLPFQVTVRRGVIAIENGLDEMIELELVHGPQPRTNPSLVNDSRANSIGSFLRLMLCNQHRQVLQALREMPLPSSPQRLEPLLLRPLVGHIKHRAHTLKVKGVLEAIFEAYPGEPLVVAPFCNLKPRTYAADPFVRAVTPPMTKFTKHLALGGGLNVRVVTSATASFCGSHISVALQRPGGVKLLDVSFTEVREVGDCLGWALHSEKARIGAEEASYRMEE